jgi:DNA-binding CsgD family transcriptional regulator
MYRLQEIVDRLLREKTPRSLLDSMHKVLREVGVEHFALMRFAHTGEPLDKWVIGYRAPPQWIEAYRHRDDPNADPIVKHSRETVEPFFWSDVIDDEGARKARGMHVPEGLVIPVPGPYGCVGTMWMGGRTRESLQKYKVVIQAIGLSCYYHLQRHCDEEPDPPATTSRLSKRERAVLDLVADGLSAQEIAEQVNLSARTVEWHMHQAMKKLGAKNRVQAVVLAIRDGLISV